jgi:hypothetical protein
MAQRPNLDLATALDTLLAALTLDANLFAGPVRPFLETSSAGVIVPRAAAFCIVRASRNPIRLFRGGRIREPVVQITIRDPDFDAGELTALDVLTATEDMSVAAGTDLADYVSAIAVESAPNYLGRDDQEDHMFTLNVEMKYVRVP